MDINNIKLTAQLLTDLYETSLVDTNTTLMPQMPEVRFLGENLKHILVIVNNTEVAYLADEEYELLSNILGACKINVIDVAVVNWQRMETKDAQQILQQLHPKQVILFDLSPIEFGLPINFPEYQVQNFDKRSYLYSPALSKLQNNVAAKKQLWSALKNLFAI